MIGSLHEHHDPMFNSRRYSSSLNDGNIRNSIDENSTYDDLLKVWEIKRKPFIVFYFLINNVISGNSYITQRERTRQTNNQIVTRTDGLFY